MPSTFALEPSANWEAILSRPQGILSGLIKDLQKYPELKKPTPLRVSPAKAGLNPEPEQTASLLYARAEEAALDRPLEALDIWASIITRFKGAKAPALQIYVIGSLYSKGITFERLGRSVDALTEWNAIERLCENLSTTALKTYLLRSFCMKLSALSALDKSDELELLYNKCLKYFNDDADPPALSYLCYVLKHKGRRLCKQADHENAIVVWDEIINRFANATDSTLRGWLVETLLDKGIDLRAIKRDEDALRVWNEIIDRFGSETDPIFVIPVARALFNKGVYYHLRHDWANSINVWNEIVRQLEDKEESSIKRLVAQSLLNKAKNLSSLSKNEDAILAYQKLVKLFSDAQETEIKQHVAQALEIKGDIFVNLKRNAEAFFTFDEIVKRFSHSDDIEIRMRVQRSAAFRDLTFFNTFKRRDDAHNYPDIISKLKTESQTGAGFVAELLAQLASRQSASGHHVEAIGFYDEIVRSFSQRSELHMRIYAANALVNKAAELRKLGQIAEAVRANDEVYSLFGDASESELQKIVAISMFNKGLIGHHLGRDGSIKDALLAIGSNYGMDIVSDIYENFDRQHKSFPIDVINSDGRHDGQEDEDYVSRDRFIIDAVKEACNLDPQIDAALLASNMRSALAATESGLTLAASVASFADNIAAAKAETTVHIPPPPKLSNAELASFKAFAKEHEWKSDSGVAPSEFIKTTFKKWLKKENGLPLAVIRDAQDNLATAYSSEISRHPSRKLKEVYVQPHKLPPGGQRPPSMRRVAELSPEDLSKRKEKERLKSARRRANRATPPAS